MISNVDLMTMWLMENNIKTKKSQGKTSLANITVCIIPKTISRFIRISMLCKGYTFMVFHIWAPWCWYPAYFMATINPWLYSQYWFKNDLIDFKNDRVASAKTFFFLLHCVPMAGDQRQQRNLKWRQHQGFL